MARNQNRDLDWGALAGEGGRTPAEIDAKAQGLIARLSLQEKINLMSGKRGVFPAILGLAISYNGKPYLSGGCKRLNLPGLRFSDGPRGIVMKNATTFPVSAGRGATWDPALEERIGEAMGMEARALGANLVAAVCINLLRHPAWGRAQETYGEDPYHLGEMGAALVRGLQRHVMACVKHFACNSIEDTRMKVDVKTSERTLREIYLPHFKRCVDEGAASVMSAYNRVNGAYCSENARLLNDILKDEWGFRGFVISDFVMGVHDGPAAAQAGLDLEMPFRQHFGGRLKRAVEKGEVPEKVIDDAVLRLLRQAIRFAQVGRSGGYPLELAASPEHRALARQAAVESIVLLKNEPPAGQRLFPEQKRDISTLFSLSRSASPMQYNLRVSDAMRFGSFADRDLNEPVLPLSPYKLTRLAVIGRLAKQANTGDRGSSMTRPAEVITPLEGIQTFAQDRFEVVHNQGLSPAEAAMDARRADAAFVFVGLTDKEEGENMFTRGGDRRDLHLPASDMALILTIASVNPRTVVVIMGSGVVIIENWKDYIPAILHIWYPGMEGGHALADIVFGQANPSGRLAVSFPKDESQLPPFDNRSASVEYGYYHGYRLLERKGQEPAYPFGFGLSYTTFAYSELDIAEKEIPANGLLHATVQVTNTGARPGDEVVQFYVSSPGQAVERPLKELKGFHRIHLKPGETIAVPLELPVNRLAYYAEEQATWLVEPGVYALYAGSSSAESDLLKRTFKING